MIDEIMPPASGMFAKLRNDELMSFPDFGRGSISYVLEQER